MLETAYFFCHKMNLICFKMSLDFPTDFVASPIFYWVFSIINK